jgi:hypothetical protein
MPFAANSNNGFVQVGSVAQPGLVHPVPEFAAKTAPVKSTAFLNQEPWFGTVFGYDQQMFSVIQITDGYYKFECHHDNHIKTMLTYHDGYYKCMDGLGNRFKFVRQHGITHSHKPGDNFETIIQDMDSATTQYVS